MLALLFLTALAPAQDAREDLRDDLSDSLSDRTPDDDERGGDEGRFGADLSAGVAPGVLLGEWPEPGVHGAFVFRYDTFIQPRDVSGW